MTKQIKGIIYSIVIGFILGIFGTMLAGYVAAIAIPHDWVSALGSGQFATIVLATATQLFSFGVLALLAGQALGRLSNRWLLNSTICYLSLLFYMTIGSALISNSKIISLNPYSGLNAFDIPSLAILPLCLIFSTWFAAKKRSQTKSYNY